MIFHIPHSSTKIPEDQRQTILLDDGELENELLLMTDLYTDDLFSCHVSKNDKAVIFPISRIIVDPERFPDDEKEVMSTVGMGVIYTKTSSGEILRNNPSSTERNHLLNSYYRPHHKTLYEAVKKELSSKGKALIIDCHSFPPSPLPYELDQNSSRPDFCIGTDNYHTPTHLTDELRDEIANKGYSVAINQPFSGSLVPMEYYGNEINVMSVMIEVNRQLYMNESTGEKNKYYTEIRKNIDSIIKTIAHERRKGGFN